MQLSIFRHWSSICILDKSRQLKSCLSEHLVSISLSQVKWPLQLRQGKTTQAVIGSQQMLKRKVGIQQSFIMRQIYEEHKKAAYFHQWNLLKKGLKYEKVISEEFHYYQNNVLLQNHCMLELVGMMFELIHTLEHNTHPDLWCQRFP